MTNDGEATAADGKESTAWCLTLATLSKSDHLIQRLKKRSL